MDAPFRHRTEAGRALARSLQHFAGREDLLVLALPHGGMPVAFEVARALGAPLDLAVVQPLLHTMGPPRREVTLGMLGFPAASRLHEATLNALALSDEALEEDLSRARRLLHQRVRDLRPSAPVPSLEGHTVVVVDDGTAAGVALRRAAGLLRGAGARALVAAVPVGAEEGLRLLASDFDEVVCCARPEPFVAVADGYARYPDVTDAEVRELLTRAWSKHAPRKMARGAHGARRTSPPPGHALPPPEEGDSPATGSSSERHRYQLATERHGRQRSP
ncbi:phosphoribosyltransferase [Archangium sp.]|uniref:phosphoribosyltransferase n=1 Tax=Archangium sp. TaxID=1872627 RepID=UPI00389ADFB9